MALPPPSNVPPMLKLGSCLGSNRVQHIDEEEIRMAIGFQPVPKFGEWDIDNPATAEFTMIFNRIREEKKALDSGIWLFPPSEKMTMTTDNVRNVELRSVIIN